MKVWLVGIISTSYLSVQMRKSSRAIGKRRGKWKGTRKLKQLLSNKGKNYFEKAELRIETSQVWRSSLEDKALLRNFLNVLIERTRVAETSVCPLIIILWNNLVHFILEMSLRIWQNPFLNHKLVSLMYIILQHLHAIACMMLWNMLMKLLWMY